MFRRQLLKPWAMLVIGLSLGLLLGVFVSIGFNLTALYGGSVVDQQSAASVRIDTSNWMRDLSAEIQDKQLKDIKIPGSHDSGTSSIGGPNEPNTWLSPDHPFALKIVPKVTVIKYAVAQGTNMKTQLEHGVRYLDFRVSPLGDSNTSFRCVHSIYGDDVESSLKDIRDFLRDHPKEIVILDFQHFFEMNTKARMTNLVGLITRYLGDYMGKDMGDNEFVTFHDPNRVPIANWTYGRLMEHSCRAIVMFSDAPGDGRPFTTCNAYGLLTGPAARIINRDWNLYSEFEKGLDGKSFAREKKPILKGLTDDRVRPQSKLQVLQTQAQPSTDFMIAHANSSLRDLATDSWDGYYSNNQEVLSWCGEDWMKKSNIVLTDWSSWVRGSDVSLDLSKAIIYLNKSR
ncbi:MAG: hypothetical protein ACOX87_14230 [Chloroflexota bacterium]|jgi:hypothetical protein